jgi:hypothetical protein
METEKRDIYSKIDDCVSNQNIENSQVMERDKNNIGRILQSH